MSHVVGALNEYKEIVLATFRAFNDGKPESGGEVVQNSAASFEPAEGRDLPLELEITFRSIMEGFLERFKDQDPLNSDAAKFIVFTVEFAEAIFAKIPTFAKIPFQLIDDILEDKSISQAKAIWPLLEGLAEKLTSENLFPKGKFTMLKTCNFLLKKLSKSLDTEFCGRILLFLASIYPISEKSAANLAGRINTGNITYYDSKDTFQSFFGSCEQPPMEEDGETTDELKITYDLYESFWKLQTLLASDLRALDQPSPSWQDFMRNARAVVDVFKSHHASSASSSGSSSGTTETYQSTKYLTSCQLFTLQLRDPLLRQQMAVQLLIFVHYLKVKSLPSITSPEQRVNFLKDIVFIHDEAKLIIESTPSQHSANLVEVVQRILDREENWIRWKNAGCNPFEKSTKIPIVKRKITENADDESSRPSKKATTKSYTFDCSDSHIKSVASKWASSQEDFNDKVQEYIDADDPENGIEEEYHPKKNHLYCWRTRRLLAQRDISLFHYMHDGDLGKGLRKFKNLPEPKPVVVTPEIVMEEEVVADVAESGVDDVVEETTSAMDVDDSSAKRVTVTVAVDDSIEEGECGDSSDSPDILDTNAEVKEEVVNQVEPTVEEPTSDATAKEETPESGEMEVAEDTTEDVVAVNDDKSGDVEDPSKETVESVVLEEGETN